MFFSSEGFPTRNTYALSPVITLSCCEGYKGSRIAPVSHELTSMTWSLLRDNHVYECVCTPLVLGDLDTGLVGLPHVCLLVQIRGTRCFALSEGNPWNLIQPTLILLSPT